MRLGFMLLELLIVLLLVGLLACYTLPCFSLFDGWIVRMELDSLYFRFLALQQRARMGNCTKKLILNSQEGSYRVEGEKPQYLAKEVCFKKWPHSPRATQGHPTKNEGCITFQNNRVLFYASGDIDAGSVYLSDTQGRFLYRLTANVGKESALSKYYANNGQWLRL